MDWVARDAETALHPSCTAKMGDNICVLCYVVLVSSVYPEGYHPIKEQHDMGFLETIKGFLGGDAIASVLESTGLAEHVEPLLGEEGIAGLVPEGGAAEIIGEATGLTGEAGA